MGTRKKTYPSGLLTISDYLSITQESAWVCNSEGFILHISEAAQKVFPGLREGEVFLHYVFRDDLPFVQKTLLEDRGEALSPYLFRFIKEADLPYACNVCPREIELAGETLCLCLARATDLATYSAEICSRIDADIAPAKEEELFDKLVRALGKHLHKNQALVGALSTDQRSISATSLWDNGHILHGASYKLEGTPCDIVVTGKAPRMYLDAVQESFPLDEDLI